MTRQMIARGQGKVVHYEAAAPYLDPLIPKFTWAARGGSLGTRSSWDETVNLSARLHEALEY